MKTSTPLPPIRDELNPNRLTLAMWDFSWLHCHHPDGGFEDWEKATDELLERGFNCVRIEAFPWIIGRQKEAGEYVTIPKLEHDNWGHTPEALKHQVDVELVEFMTTCKRKDIQVILSTWGFGCEEYPGVFNMDEKEALDLRHTVWDKTLDLLAQHDLLDIVPYVDLDQEFPMFSPIKKAFKRSGNEIPAAATDDPASAMVEAGQIAGRDSFNEEQSTLLKGYMISGLEHFHHRYPQLRFTYSFTAHVEDFRAMGNIGLDVLELHFWIHARRFDARTGFSGLPKDRDPSRKYEDHQQRIDQTLATVGPMLRREQENKVSFGAEWAEAIAAPLVCTESWGPWWHMDHPDLRWDWLRDWCEWGMQRASEYNFWGATPWNYAHPYWENWERDLEWYQKVNRIFSE